MGIEIGGIASVIFNLLDDSIEEIVEKLVGVLMLTCSEKAVELFELVDESAGSNGALVERVSADMNVEGTKGGHQGRRGWRNLGERKGLGCRVCDGRGPGCFWTWW